MSQSPDITPGLAPLPAGAHSETRLAQAGSRWCDRTGAVSMPIYHASTFRHPAPGESTGFDYSRSGNPTRTELESTIAQLEGGSAALAFSTGMSAIDCVFRLFTPGDIVLVLEDLYGGTWRLLEGVYRQWGLDIRYIDPDQPLLAQIVPAAKAIFVESPTNPLLRVIDLQALIGKAKVQKQLVIVDNTFLTFQLQKPLALGADVVVYSGTKFLGGHNDLLAGLVVARDSAIAERLAWLQKTSGAVLGPQDSWLLLRGLKTLALRLERQQENARQVAEFLQAHPHVSAVHWPGLASHPNAEVQKRQANGPGAMLGFSVDNAQRVYQILRKVRVFLYAESLGGCESLITFPVLQTHADVSPEVRERLGVTDRLLRVSVGVENAADLIADLQQALDGTP